MISTIANINFNLIDSSELNSLSTQVEHLLLVDLKEDEVPEKTRLSFAANKISQLAQSKLLLQTASIDEYILYENYKVKHQNLLKNFENYKKESNKGELIFNDEERNSTFLKFQEKIKSIEKKLNMCQTNIANNISKIEEEFKNSFSYILRALEERPDRTRLWLRAVSYCRISGIDNINDLFKFLKKYRDNNANSSEYIFSILLSEISYNIVLCTMIICKDNDISSKIYSAKSFLSSLLLISDFSFLNHWYSKASWKNYCIIYYLSFEMISFFYSSKNISYNININNEVVNLGQSYFSNSCNSIERQSYFLEFVKYWLNKSSTFLNSFILHFQNKFDTKSDCIIWRYFPSIVPYDVLKNFSSRDFKKRKHNTILEGWWFDTLYYNTEETKKKIRKYVPQKYKYYIDRKNDKKINLIEWCNSVIENELSPSDPQNSEWTALEITKQITILLFAQPSFSMRAVKLSNTHLPRVHPQNFTLPAEILKSKNLTWDQWKSKINNSIRMVESKYQVLDYRYSPMQPNSGEYFDTINNTRGLGLILLGLLKKKFEFPPLWNGFGQNEILNSLKTVLNMKINYSSWTLGILEGCLSARSIENLYINSRKIFKNIELDNDQINDPLRIVNINQFVKYITKAEKVLEENQISTLKGKARQLIPVSIKQLTMPEWNVDFDDKGKV